MTSLLTYLAVGAIISTLISGLRGHSMGEFIRFGSFIGLANILVWSLFFSQN